jgi:hypothetical protein
LRNPDFADGNSLPKNMGQAETKNVFDKLFEFVTIDSPVLAFS